MQTALQYSMQNENSLHCLHPVLKLVLVIFEMRIVGTRRGSNPCQLRRDAKTPFDRKQGTDLQDTRFI